MASGLDSLKTTDAALDSGQKGLSSHLPSWARTSWSSTWTTTLTSARNESGRGIFISPPFPSSISHPPNSRHLVPQGTGSRIQMAKRNTIRTESPWGYPIALIWRGSVCVCKCACHLCSFDAQQTSGKLILYFCIVLNGALIPYLVLLGYPTYPT